MSHAPKDVLNGWKEIATYLGRDPRTVERWEKQRGLPVRRLPGEGRSSVYALVSELQAWRAQGSALMKEAARDVADDAGVDLGNVRQPAAESAGSRQEAGVPMPAGVEESLTIAKRGVRWPASRVAFAAMFCLVLAAAGWMQARTRARRVGAPMSAVRSRTLVPSSAVPGVDELYWRGCYQSELRSPDSLKKGAEAFSAALRKDPSYAPAYAGLAIDYILSREYGTSPDEEAYAKAKEAAEHALALDPDLPQAHAALGFVEFFWRWDAAAAEEHFRAAQRINPALPLAHHWHGSVLIHQGRFREGMAELHAAQRLDPSSGAILTLRAFGLGLAGHRAESLEMLQEALNTDRAGVYRNPATMYNVLAIVSLFPPRDIPRYLAESMRVAELRRDTATLDSLQEAERVYRSQGENAMWRALLRDEERRRAGGPRTYAMARYEAELGERDRAFKDLEGLLARRDPALISVCVDPLMAPLHGDSRYKRLRVGMGLPMTGEEAT